VDGGEGRGLVELGPLGLQLLDLLADLEEGVLHLQDLAHIGGLGQQGSQRLLLGLQAADAGVLVHQLAADVFAPERLLLDSPELAQSPAGVVEALGRHPHRQLA
jgi:hypothetical protein